MNDQECRQWLAVTQSSRYHWTEDEITHLNGRGTLYYHGGEDGVYMRIQPDGRLSVGTYEGALPHIGEALFQPRMTRDCGSFDKAFQTAVELGGKQFLADMFSSDQPSQPGFQTAAGEIGMQMC